MQGTKKKFGKLKNIDIENFTELEYDDMESTRDWRAYAYQSGRTFSTYSSRHRSLIICRGSPFIIEILEGLMQHIKMSTCKWGHNWSNWPLVGIWGSYASIHSVRWDLVQSFSSNFVKNSANMIQKFTTASITDFHQLSGELRTHFVGNRRQERTTCELMALK